MFYMQPNTADINLCFSYCRFTYSHK